MPELAMSSAVGGLRRVLLADYDDVSRQTYRDYLAVRGLRVEEASDGREALAKAISTRPDVVVTETALSGFSGYDLCSLLRQDLATNRTPIIFLTTDAPETASELARVAGGDLVLAKPCLPRLLMLEMRRLLRRSRELRAQGTLLRGRLAEQLAKSHQLKAKIEVQRHQRALSQLLARYETITPPIAPPDLVCPLCDRVLVYQKSHLGGVSERHPEQWDYFACSIGCGTFQYRQRTRRLRKIST
jgi:DNA-binding response OmpR family regulator